MSNFRKPRERKPLTTTFLWRLVATTAYFASWTLLLISGFALVSNILLKNPTTQILITGVWVVLAAAVILAYHNWMRWWPYNYERGGKGYYDLSGYYRDDDAGEDAGDGSSLDKNSGEGANQAGANAEDQR